MLLLIDNYDSFTFNLVQVFEELGASPQVIRNDHPDLQEKKLFSRLDKVIISPGPSNPLKAGLCLKFLDQLPLEIPVLGVCLGHQILAHHAGYKIIRAKRIMHGKVSKIFHQGQGIFSGLPSPFTATRYHSLLLDPKTPDPKIRLSFTALAEEAGEIMGLQYPDRPWYGVQFHPESILSPDGPKLLANFLNLN